MDKGLIQHIIDNFESYNSKTLLVENNDGFLFRKDIQAILERVGIIVCTGTSLEQRIAYELREEDGILVLPNRNKVNVLEDIARDSVLLDFSLEYYMTPFHIPSIVKVEVDILEKLFKKKLLFKQNKKETLALIHEVKSAEKRVQVPLNMDEFISDFDSELEKEHKDWNKICELISSAILSTIGSSQLQDVMKKVEEVNDLFQHVIQQNYQQSKNSSAVKKPQIVSKVLDYIDFNFRNEKIALIVADGLAYWQYELLQQSIKGIKQQYAIYSWLPSITQLSRQAIFRGDNPLLDYKQGPINESKLWFSYWESKGVNKHEIKYAHEDSDLSQLSLVSKFALVLKDLDAHMHHSHDFKMLLGLTKDWIERSKIISIIDELRDKGFRVFLTTDHGNIEAKGWRSLKGREKLGTNISGSRSERHIEYSKKWLTEEFMANNPELKDDVVMDDQSIYFKNNLSFSKSKTLVTHGGSHILEVLIPFVEISNDE